MFFQVQSLVKLFPPRARKQRASKDAELFTVRNKKGGWGRGGVSSSSLLISQTKLIAAQQQNETDFHRCMPAQLTLVPAYKVPTGVMSPDLK